MSTSGDIMSTSGGYHEYIGGYHDACGGYHEYIGGGGGWVMSTSRYDIMSTSRDVQYIRVFNRN